MRDLDQKVIGFFNESANVNDFFFFPLEHLLCQKSSYFIIGEKYVRMYGAYDVYEGVYRWFGGNYFSNGRRRGNNINVYRSGVSSIRT